MGRENEAKYTTWRSRLGGLRKRKVARARRAIFVFFLPEKEEENTARRIFWGHPKRKNARYDLRRVLPKYNNARSAIACQFHVYFMFPGSYL